MDILNKIVVHKRTEVENRKKLFPFAILEQSISYVSTCVSMVEYLKREDKSGIIAEFKRKSPSKSDINLYAKVEEVTIGYMQTGCSGLSVLTDEHFFGGKNEDLRVARKFNYCPILRKDFIIDEYQIHEAKSIGADVVLLIAEILTKKEVSKFAKLAKSLGMEVLFEIHSLEQLDKLNPAIDIVGVNNRNLKTFKVDIKQSIEFAASIPTNFTKISESGINDPTSILQLRDAGYQGFLIGEHFMKSANPATKCRQFIKEINSLHKERSITNS